MNKAILRITGTATLATGLIFAQNPPIPEHRQGGGRAYMLDHLATRLNLTDTQKQQAQSIFQSEHQQAQSVRESLKQAHDSLNAAVKSNASDAEIDRIANGMAPLLAQTTAIQAKALAKFYAILTADQRATVGDNLGHLMGGGFGGGRRGSGQMRNQKQ